MSPEARTQAERVAESTSRIIDAAIDLMGQQEWASTSVAQITDRAGYSREMVRVRFGSKQGLIESIVQNWEDGVLVPIPPHLDGLQSLIFRTKVLEDLLEHDARLARAAISYTFQSLGDPERRSDLDTWLRRVADDTEMIVRRGQADGSLLACLDPPVIARFVTDRAIGLALRWLVDGRAPVSEDFAEWRTNMEQSWSATGRSGH